MKLRNFLLFGVAALLLVTYWSCDNSSKDDEPTTGTISGTITNATTQNPVSGATVSLTGTSHTTTSGGDGAYSISDVEADTYTLAVSATGYQSYQQADVTVTAGQTTTANAALTVAAGGSDAASQAVTSDDEDAIIETPGGARIYIPEGAVPRQADGSASTMVFSIEADDEYVVTPPEGETVDSRLYRFGPEGFSFERKVTVEIPLAEGVEPGDMEVRMYRIDPTTGENEYMVGSYHTDTRTVSAQTYHFSPWFLTCGAIEDPEAWGCAWVTNNSNTWVGLCVVEYDLDFPERDTQLIPSDGLSSYWAPWNHSIGVTNEGEWWLPQGTFTICVQYYHHNEDPMYTNRIWDQQITVTQPAHGSWISGLHNWDCTSFSVGGDEGTADGMCDCTPTPTTPVGTGDIQATLTWWNVLALDLDLWVTDPNGDRCYYGSNPSPSGGVLDRDNLCSNYINGRSENIYWTSSPLAGEYIVEVDWYSDCGNSLTSQGFNVRTVVQGNSRTIPGTINNGETVEVTRFTIPSSGPATFLPGRGVVERPDIPRPPKG